MKTRLLLATGACALGSIAAAQPASAQPVAMSQQDQTYLVAAHQGHLAEILSGTRAAVSPQGMCVQVRQIGPTLVADHSQLDAMGAQAAVAQGVALPLTPNTDQTQQLLATGMKTGRDFDLAWLQMQQGFHTDALTASRQEQEFGGSEQVKAMARNAEPVIEQHLAMVREALAQC
jgi:putative membrane protein